MEVTMEVEPSMAEPPWRPTIKPQQQQREINPPCVNLESGVKELIGMRVRAEKTRVSIDSRANQRLTTPNYGLGHKSGDGDKERAAGEKELLEEEEDQQNFKLVKIYAYDVLHVFPKFQALVATFLMPTSLPPFLG
ncbi:hypothetical protein Scep_004142 [Stephania cephalantha]|uniref:Uncharacterized protein n=1 Tax=Stephania cephalantha TaxID=152367 RepID=A0AAP0PV54_9MAGN